MNSQVRTGCDLVDVEEFKKRILKAPEILKVMFSEAELAHAETTESKAGIFAAKEAIIKALSLPPESWQHIIVSWEDNGRPKVNVVTNHTATSIDISISHQGGIAMATAVSVHQT